MKKLALVLTLALVLAFAMPVFANPFSDVPADHWAYDAISKLAADGVITGNPDGTYTGKKNLTRYEIAVIVAKAMAAAEANGDKVTAENQATINKLAAEYSNELAALGVKVAALEKKIGNVKFTGDARIRHIENKMKDSTKEKTTDMRVRLVATATVNDKVAIVTRITTNNYDLGKDNGNASKTEADRFYVKYADKGVTATVGRQDVFLGKGTIIDDVIKGAIVSAPVGNYTVTLVHGRTDIQEIGDVDFDPSLDLTAIQFDGVKLMNKLTLGVDLGTLKSKKQAFNDNSKELKVAALNLDYAINDKLSLGAEFAKADVKGEGVSNTDKSATYIALTAKDLLAKKTKTELSYAQYGAAYAQGLGAVTTQVDQINKLYADATDKIKVWRLVNEYEVMPNTTLYLDLSQAKGKADTGDTKQDRVEAGVKFAF